MKPQKPVMQLALGNIYTGALAVTGVAGKLLCNRFRSATSGDELVVLDARAEIVDHVDLPANSLAWEAVFAAAIDRVLINVDHQIVAWQLGAGLEPLTPVGRVPASFLSVAGTRAAWFDAPNVIVRDLATGTDVFRHAVTPELYRGHTPQLAGALSPDGSMLACCSQAGTVDLFDVKRGSVVATIRGDFEMIEELAFTGEGRWLLAQELYGRNALLCFDAATGTPRADWPELLSPIDFSLDREGMRLALGTHHRERVFEVEVFEISTMRALGTFAIDQVVKRFELAWVDDRTLGTHTDAGYASLYASPGRD